MILMGTFRIEGYCQSASCKNKRKMYRIVLLILCSQTLSHPVTERSSSRHVRELTECCPCPDSKHAGQDMLDRDSQLVRTSDLDDCPCRPRSADSEGASSIFFPSAIRPDMPILKPNIPQEETKNLLEPEMALATSMLDTLREATEEEYQDALVRDAARNAATMDTEPEESARNVVIIVKPDNNDLSSEASHIKEARCIQPLKIKTVLEPINPLSETLKFSQLKQAGQFDNSLLQMDGDLGASNLKMNTVKNNENTSNLLQNQIPKLNISLKTLIKDNIANSKKPTVGINENASPFLKQFRNPLLKFRFNKDITFNESQTLGDKTNQLLKRAQLPLNLRNLLNLRDIEIIPKNIIKSPLNKPQLLQPKSVKPIFKENENEINFKSRCKDVKKTTNSCTNLDGCENTEKINNEKENIILDASPSASQNQPVTELNISKDGTIENVDLSNLKATESDSDFQLNNTNDKLEQVTSCSAQPESTESVRAIDNMSNNLNLDKNYDSDTGSSNMIATLVPLEATEKQNNDLQPQSQESIENFNYSVENDQNNSQNKENHTSLADIHKEKNIFLQVEKVKPTQESMFIKKNSFSRINSSNKSPIHSGIIDELEYSENKCKHNENSRNSHLMIPNSDENDQVEVNLEDATDITNDDTRENKDAVSMNDLQEMSDKLLDLDSKNQNNDCITINSSECDKITSEKSLQPIISDTRSNESIDNGNNSIEMEVACPVDKEYKDIGNEEKPIKFDTNNNKEKEMETGASDTVTKVMPNLFESLNPHLNLRDPFIGDNVKNPFNLFKKPLNLFEERSSLFDNIDLQLPSKSLTLSKNPLEDILDLNTKWSNLGDHIQQSGALLRENVGQGFNNPLKVLNLNSNIPTLGDLQKQMINIFNSDGRSAEEESCSIENDSTDESLAMVPEASTTNFHQKIPSLRNLDDFSVEILRNKPLHDLRKPLKLNSGLNSFRSKNPTTSDLELKSIKVRPKLNNARLGKEKLSLSDVFNGPSNYLESLPSLNDLRNTFKTNSRHILDNPLHPQLSLLPKNMRSNDFENMADTIRQNTQKTIKGLQHKMKTNLKKANSKTSFSDSLAKPQELLDDVHDKLKGIQYDLNDRLSSFHEDIGGLSKLKTYFEQPRNKASRNIMTNFRSSKTKSPSDRLQTAASTIIPQTIHPFSPNTDNLNDNTIKEEPKDYINSLQDVAQKSQIEQENNTPILNQENSLIPQFPRIIPLRQNPAIPDFLKERKTLLPSFKETTNFEKNIKRPTVRTVASPFKTTLQPNIRISFETTSAVPILSTQPVLQPTAFGQMTDKHSSLNTDYSVSKIAPLDHRLKSSNDHYISPIKIKPLETLPMLSSSHSEEIEYNKYNFLQNQKYVKPSVLREVPNHKRYRNMLIENFTTRVNNNEDTIDKLSRTPSVFEPKLSRAMENSDLFNIHDNSDSNRLSSANPKLTKNSSKSDMLRSPTDNTDIVLSKSLKENVVYKCKMVCIPEINQNISGVN